MCRYVFRLLLPLLVVAVTSSVVCAQTTEISTDDFTAAQRQAEAFAKEFGPGSVLFVSDIDNTLLAMNQDLGSDQWFTWQSGLLNSDPQARQLAACSFPALLQAQALLFSLSDMHPPQASQPASVKALQAQGIVTMAHTSRGPDVRDVTLRELSDSRYDLAGHTINPQAGYAGSYLPYNVERIEDSGLTREEALAWLGRNGEVSPPREVSFNEGVYMTAGQHKGAMLRMLLHKSGDSKRFKAIVFVDDTPKNIKAVREAFKNVEGIAVATFHYTHEDENVRRFNENADGRQSQAVRQWRRLSRTRSRIFPAMSN